MHHQEKTYRYIIGSSKPTLKCEDKLRIMIENKETWRQ